MTPPLPANKIRAFIAIELPDEIRQQLDLLTARFRKNIPGGVRWVAAANIHLTLIFLGDAASDALDRLMPGLQQTAHSLAPFSIRVTGVGAFPNAKRPRVIWTGLQAPAELNTLHKAVEDQTVQAGFPREERPFSPHLTLGRVQPSARFDEVALVSAALERVKAGLLGEFTANGFTLFRSDLRPSGAVYTRLKTFEFSKQS